MLATQLCQLAVDCIIIDIQTHSKAEETRQTRFQRNDGHTLRS
ncbi:hypothetical protein T12_14715 [Trichinella patagoniensis]|uniref:Uncharacterized protein n=1 Tax=Trichinella patagoniensis TaxID=990121 RepID=A0A0V0ZHK9_9BILA|nr:hypothetical protein T12_14715 [Trichinella patagoniensis]